VKIAYNHPLKRSWQVGDGGSVVVACLVEEDSNVMMRVRPCVGATVNSPVSSSQLWMMLRRGALAGTPLAALRLELEGEEDHPGCSHFGNLNYENSHCTHAGKPISEQARISVSARVVH
jgi:hypothetical protein